MVWLPCSYFGSEFELTEERLGHIRRKHAELGRNHYAWIEAAVPNPQRIHQRLWARDEFLLTRSADPASGDRVVVVVVVEDAPLDDSGSPRRWVATAYIAREGEVGGEVIWESE